jgi:hypothetical protein
MRRRYLRSGIAQLLRDFQPGCHGCLVTLTFYITYPKGMSLCFKEWPGRPKWEYRCAAAPFARSMAFRFSSVSIGTNRTRLRLVPSTHMRSHRRRHHRNVGQHHRGFFFSEAKIQNHVGHRRDEPVDCAEARYDLGRREPFAVQLLSPCATYVRFTVLTRTAGLRARKMSSAIEAFSPEAEWESFGDHD